MRTRVGYAGGTTPHPTYRDLGDHTETLEIDFDPTVISYEALLETFWAEHDPTRRSWSRQYRSAIFWRSDAQRRTAEVSKARQEARGKRILTDLEPLAAFHRAEDYHQKYYLRQREDLMNLLGPLPENPDAFTDAPAAARLNGLAGGHGRREAVLRELGLDTP